MVTEQIANLSRHLPRLFGFDSQSLRHNRKGR